MNIESWTRAFVAEIYKPISEVTKDMMEAMQMYNFADNEEHNQIVAKVGSSVTSIDVAKEMFNNASCKCTASGYSFGCIYGSIHKTKRVYLRSSR